MRQYQGLNAFSALQIRPTATVLAAWLAEDLQHCQCFIYGKNPNEQVVTLARLHLQAQSWLYHSFEQRIDFTVEGYIIRNDFPPLTYHLQGQNFSLNGRCSMISKVCGVDLYLSASYTAQRGDFVQQRFSIALPLLLKMLIT